MDNVVFNNDNKKLFKDFGKDLNSIYMYFLKHLNRYHRVVLQIPEWRDDKFGYNRRFIITELKKDRNFASYYILSNIFVNGKSIEKDSDLYRSIEMEPNLYRFQAIYLDVVENIVIQKDFYKNRRDVFLEYIGMIRNARDYRNMVSGDVHQCINLDTKV